MKNRGLRIAIAIPFICIVLPIHYLAMAIELVGFIFYRLCFWVIRQRADSFSDYMGNWWF